MKQFLLATTLIAIPVAGFAAVETFLLPKPPAISAVPSADALGDLSAYELIVNDTQVLVDSGQLAAAENRITDFETQWDDAEAALRPLAPTAWGNVDAAADDAFAALRAKRPDPAAVTAMLGALSDTLAHPSGDSTYTGGVGTVAGIAVTDANGHAIPCETMLRDLREALSKGAITDIDKKAEASDLQAQATERCNADDDKRADAFAAQALALAAH